jgi:hypothetical protein
MGALIITKFEALYVLQDDSKATEPANFARISKR